MEISLVLVPANIFFYKKVLAMCILCRLHVDVHKGVQLMWTGVKNLIFCGCHKWMAPVLPAPTLFSISFICCPNSLQTYILNI